MPRLGVSFDGRDAPEAFRAKLACADAVGVGTLWIASHLFQREPIALASLALANTRRARAALMAVSPYVVHPVYAAMAAATLDELFPGRVLLSLGVGAPGDLTAAGIEAPRPVATLREAVAVARELLGGRTATLEGSVFRVRGRGLASGTRPVPLVLAASGPKMLGLAGEIADAVLISGGASVEFVRWCLEQVDRGARGRSVERCGLVYVSAASNAEKARARLRRTLAVTLRGRHHAQNVALAGGALDHEALTTAVAAGAWEDAESLIGDNIIDRHSACGTPDQVRERLQAYASAGLDQIVFAGIRQPAHLEAALDAAKTLEWETTEP